MCEAFIQTQIKVSELSSFSYTFVFLSFFFKCNAESQLTMYNVLNLSFHKLTPTVNVQVYKVGIKSHMRGRVILKRRKSHYRQVFYLANSTCT